ncbi:alpha-E domain-containing protein [Solimonas marina]|uniref:Alpha-E domain-containing protein n=1 Tax=Solimonas marina TaxID=2714601 RepID=A0A969W628_9GAMM|nr:alpha-E domain-containing protein [Solimonas marina]NKF21326.1 alpha-E domain-containing protein [Solimonas marina]
MLSRVAENLYWLGRYIVRAENTARLISVHSHLLLDLPRGMTLGWSPLIDILGANEAFVERFGGDGALSEANVVRFLITDTENRSSVAASIAAAREILRIVRDSTPRDAWEHLNATHLFLQERGERHLPRAQRQTGLDRVIDTMLMMRGILGANMSHDVGYQFMRIGMNIEQADMTTRIVDVRTVDLIQSRSSDELQPFQHIQWMSVLRSLTALQAYRRHEKIRVSGPAVLRFLLQDRGFPRSVLYGLNAVSYALPRLPAYRGSERSIDRVRALIQDANFERLLERGLHEWIDEIQIGIGAIHEALTLSYFKPGEPPPPAQGSGVQTQTMTA